MNEYYPTLLEMAPWHKKYPVTWVDGWHIFRGPKIGTVAPDGYVVWRSNEPKISLHALIDQTFHPKLETAGQSLGELEQAAKSDKKLFVILFDGINHGDTTKDSKAFADELEKEFSDLLDCFVVTRYYDDQQYDPINNIL